MGEHPWNDPRHTFPRDNVVSIGSGLLTPNGVLEEISRNFAPAKMCYF